MEHGKIRQIEKVTSYPESWYINATDNVLGCSRSRHFTTICYFENLDKTAEKKTLGQWDKRPWDAPDTRDSWDTWDTWDSPESFAEKKRWDSGTVGQGEPTNSLRFNKLDCHTALGQ